MQQVKHFIKEFAGIALVSLAVVLPVRLFIAQPFLVSGASMDNTFHDKNYLIVDQISYHFKEPARGNVVIFKVPPAGLALQKIDPDKTVYYIKRVIGLPGETVEVNGNTVTIYNTEHPDGIVLDEPYAYYDPNGFEAFAHLHKKITLEEGEYFVLGDNRYNSLDSRFWGALPRENVKGVALIRLFPFSEIGIYPGDFETYNQ